MTDPAMISHKICVGDQTFRIRINSEEVPFYDRVAKLTDSMFRETSRQSVVGGTQTWAMTAFQIACELMDLQDDAESAATEEDRIRRMIERIEEVTSDV